MRTVDPVKHEQKRQAILEAAITRFADNGFQRTSISSICAEAGISAGHLYHYFENKEAILGAIAENALNQATTHFSDMITGADPISALMRYLDRIRGFRDSGRHRLVLDLLSEANRDPALAEILHQHTEGMRELMATVLRQGQATGQVDRELNPDLAATVLIGVFDGTKIMPVRHRSLDRDMVIDMIQLMIERFLVPRN